MTDHPSDDLIRAIISAHDGGPLVESIAEADVPADIDGVYAMQDRVMAGIGPSGGWKILAGAPGDPICSPIPANRYFENGATINAAHHRFIITEVEVAVKLGADLTGTPDAAAAEAAIASVHPVLEMVGNPFANRDATARNVQLGDLQSNGAVIVGPAVDAGIREALPTLPVTLTYGEKVIKEVETGADWSAILAALVWLAPRADKRGFPLKAGQVIITGSRIAVPLEQAEAVAAKLGHWGEVSARFTY